MLSVKRKRAKAAIAYKSLIEWPGRVEVGYASCTCICMLVFMFVYMFVFVLEFVFVNLYLYAYICIEQQNSV